MKLKVSVEQGTPRGSIQNRGKKVLASYLCDTGSMFWTEKSKQESKKTIKTEAWDTIHHAAMTLCIVLRPRKSDGTRESIHPPACLPHPSAQLRLENAWCPVTIPHVVTPCPRPVHHFVHQDAPELHDILQPWLQIWTLSWASISYTCVKGRHGILPPAPLPLWSQPLHPKITCEKEPSTDF